MATSPMMPQANIRALLYQLNADRLKADPGADPYTLTDLAAAAKLPQATVSRVQQAGGAKASTLRKIVNGFRALGLAVTMEELLPPEEEG